MAVTDVNFYVLTQWLPVSESSRGVYRVVILFVVMLLCVSCQNTKPSFTCSLDPNQRYVCPGVAVTYVCNGTGSVIDFYAPPEVPFNSPLTFIRGSDEVGRGLSAGPISANLMSADEPFMVANVFVDESFFFKSITLMCEVQSEAAKIEYKVAGISTM